MKFELSFEDISRARLKYVLAKAGFNVNRVVLVVDRLPYERLAELHPIDPEHSLDIVCLLDDRLFELAPATMRLL